MHNIRCIVGSVVECSPATRAARVRFPDDAYFIISMIYECSICFDSVLVLKLYSQYLMTDCEENYC